ncbi:MAG TPA: outer membrane beta-barrel protein [Candidatus Saccharimonadales bacterium]|nr:outer membrane beta-barrel protein [Candidatus Saccharimonadales bacterium]
MRRSAVLLTVIFLILAGGIASAQQTDVSVSGIGVYTDTVTGKGVQETATKSGGVLVSFRHFPYHHNGVEVNYSYTKNTQRYSDLSGSQLADVQSSIHEVTGAYVFHVTRGAVQPFALAGAGLLIFSPTSHALDTADPSITSQKRPAFLYGAGLDVRLNRGLAVRAQYRGLIYKAPNFFGNAVALHTSSAMHMAEPSVGLVYRF